MARPRKSDEAKQEPRITVRFNPRDLQTVEDRAAKAGVSVAEYVRRRALSERIVAKDKNIRRADPMLILRLQHYGSNLNKVARIANSKGEIDTDRVDQVCRVIEDLASQASSQPPDPALILQLNRIGVNLKQLAQVADINGETLPESAARATNLIEPIVIKAVTKASYDSHDHAAREQL